MGKDEVMDAWRVAVDILVVVVAIGVDADVLLKEGEDKEMIR